MGRFASCVPDDGRRRTTHEHVRHVLRQAVVLGVLAPGERMVQSEIAEELQVSVTPVREALRDLVNEGLVDMDPHRGASVRVVGDAEARDIHELRLVLEPLAMRWAAEHLGDSELDEAQRLLDAMDAEVDHTRWLELHRRLHLALIDGCGSPRLVQMLRNLRNSGGPRQSAALRASLASAARTEHQPLLDALRARDGDAAAAFMVRHLGAAPATHEALLQP